MGTFGTEPEWFAPLPAPVDAALAIPRLGHEHTRWSHGPAVIIQMMLITKLWPMESIQRGRPLPILFDDLSEIVPSRDQVDRARERRHVAAIITLMVPCHAHCIDFPSQGLSLDGTSGWEGCTKHYLACTIPWSMCETGADLRRKAQRIN